MTTSTPAPREWWRDFFTGLAAESWHAMPTPAMTAGEVDRLLPRLQVGTAARLLDVPCGDGRHMAELRTRGFAVTGVDQSATLLAHARAQGLDVHERDMRHLVGLGPFDGAYCLGNSFGYLDDSGHRAFLAAVRQVLRPGAVFLLEATVAESILPNLRPGHCHEFAGYTFRGAVSYDASSGVLRSDYTIDRSSEREQKSAFVQLYTARQVLAMLRESGFAAAELTAPDGGAFALGTSIAWFTSRA